MTTPERFPQYPVGSRSPASSDRQDRNVMDNPSLLSAWDVRHQPGQFPRHLLTLWRSPFPETSVFRLQKLPSQSQRAHDPVSPPRLHPALVRAMLRMNHTRGRPIHPQASLRLHANGYVQPLLQHQVTAATFSRAAYPLIQFQLALLLSS